jgi:hypothetical protein
MSKRTNRDIEQALVAIVSVATVAMGLAWAIQGNEFFMLKVFAPKIEQVRRETFEESKAYNDGTAQELRRMQSEYIRATPEQKAALASVILHQVAGYDEGRLSPDLRSFLDSLKSNQGVH